MWKTGEECIVHDGCERARSAELPSIRAEVEREYAERLKTAGLFKRLLLRREIRREVEKRLGRIAPRSGLYFFGGREKKAHFIVRAHPD
jgi:hypothetical protein